jgi:uncharacterized protein (TIGR02302 family)
MTALPTVLRRKRARASLVLWLERLAPVGVAAGAPLLAYLCLAALGVIGALPLPLGLVALAVTPLAACGLGWLRVRDVRRPTQAEIDRRLEQGAGDVHRPLMVLQDQPAWAGDAAVWQAHRDRAAARIPKLRAGLPRLGWPLSAALAGGVLLAVACLGAAGPSRLWQALTPPSGPTLRPPLLQAWIVPPPHTLLAPIFLPEAGQAAAPAIAVPMGSHLTVSLSGGDRAPRLVFAAASQTFRRLDRASFQADLTLTASGVLEVRRGGDRLAQWHLAVAADQPPTIRLTGPVAIAGPLVRLPWTAADDYGLASVTAELRRADRPDAPPLQLKLSLGGAPRTASGGGLPDLTALPWAGLPVTLRYVARDGGGQTAATAPASLTLPERPFNNPLARALIGVRRGLVQDANGAGPAASALDRLSPMAAGQVSLAQWLNLRGIAALLALPPGHLGQAGQDEAVARLWQLAVQIEDAGVATARDRLAQARAALQDALSAPTTPAQQQRIAALTQQIQRAMQRYLDALQKQAAQAGQAPPEQADGKTVDPAELQRMAQQMQDAARAGRLAEAQSRLQQLGALLDGLHPSHKSAAQPGKSPDNPELDALLRDQLALRQHSDQRLSDDADPRAAPGAAPGHDPDEAASQPDPAAQRKNDAQAQQALRQRLGQLAAKLGEQTGTVPDALAQAAGAMQQAEQALAKHDDAAARAAQQRALESLGAGGQQMAQGQGQPGQQAGANGPTDPFGRPLGEGGQAPDESDSTLNLGGDAATGRALRDELRRRAADRTRPQPELNYIDRLLKPE